MDTDVIIVGGGPTGLMLAGELRLSGADVVVVDKLPAPSGQSRGLGFTARTVEVFDQRGLLPEFGEIETSPMGHFGGLVFDYSVLDGAHFGARSIPQSKTEEVLEAWGTRLGVDIRRGWEFVSFEDDGAGVEVVGQTTDGEQRIRASYLVGCDGGQSSVRKAAGFDFPGTPPTREMFLADVAGCDLRPRLLGERVPNGMVMSAPLGEGVDRIIVCERGAPAPERTEQLDFEEIADAWERLTGEDIRGGTPGWISSFTDSARQVSEYRRGRVLLAGDAAHIHLPAGGQGLSVGVQDAVNLGWKLASTVQGWAPEGLLDTYHAERHPVGSQVLQNTRAQGVLFLSGDEVEPLRDVFAELVKFEDVSRLLAGMVSHLDIRYDVGTGKHPLLGRRMPNLKLYTKSGETTTTTALLHTGKAFLLDVADDAELREEAANWSDRVLTVTANTEGELTEPALIRPDGHVVWPTTEKLSVVLHRWFGNRSAGRTRRLA